MQVEVKGVWRSVKHGCGMAVALPGKTLEEMTGARIKATNYRMVSTVDCSAPAECSVEYSRAAECTPPRHVTSCM